MIREIYKEEYPDTLKNMKSPPKRLLVRGLFPVSQDQRYLCIVGSRNWTSYGRDAVNKIVSGLKGYPISIVSGLAIGIDSISHLAALDAGLHCVAFPGSSLEWNEMYPRRHVGLAQIIVERGGALVSEWEPGYPTGKWAFPARNRLMAGLSHAVLIIEAAQKSGSLMTAKHAEEFDRDVFAVPGPIDAPQSYGPHMLIQHGAALVTSSYDVLAAMGFDVRRTANGGVVHARTIPKQISDDPLSAKIMQIIVRGPESLDSLIDKTQATVAALNERLTLLELEGLIRMEGATVRMI
jgi:DNA processing protein